MFLTKPAPFKEAAEAIASLAPVDRATFDNLLPELRDAAMTIAGIEGLDVVMKVRDIIARLPLGGDFEELKSEIEEELSPWLNEKAAGRRAMLLLRLHGFRFYAAAGYQQMEAHQDAFPFRQYVATMDEKTRHSHRALHGVVLPSSHPFWKNHTGPWAWGCRCEAVPLTAGAADRLKAADAKRDPDKALVLDGPLLQKLEQGELVRGPTMIFDIRTDAQRTGDPNAFEWQPGRAAMPLSKIRGMYPPAEFNAFEAWAKNQTTGDGRNLWEALTKNRDDTPPPPVPVPANVPPPAPAPAATLPPASTGVRTRATVEAEVRRISEEMMADQREYDRLMSESLADIRDSNPDTEAREAQTLKLLAKLMAGKEAFRNAVQLPPAQRGTFTIEALMERKWDRKTLTYDLKPAAGAALLKHCEKGAGIVKRWVAADLLRPVRVESNRGRAYYSPSKDCIGVSGSTALEVLAHEMVHPIESKNPEVLAASRAFLAMRAGGDRPESLRKLTGCNYRSDETAFKDDWVNRKASVYCGKLYSSTGRIEDARSSELLTMGIQRLESSAFEFHRDDPDYFWFVLATLQKL